MIRLTLLLMLGCVASANAEGKIDACEQARRADAIMDRVFPEDDEQPESGPGSVVTLPQIDEILLDHGMTEAEIDAADKCPLP